MPNKKSNYLKMLQLGEWLELYLNPNIKPWQYKKLAEDAIEILNIDFKISENDITLQAITLIEKQPPEIKKWYLNSNHIEQFISKAKNPNCTNADDPCNIMSLITAAAAGMNGFLSMDSYKEWISSNAIRILDIYSARLIIDNLLKTIISSEKPWTYAIDEIFKPLEDNSDNLKKAIKEFDSSLSPQILINHYSEIADTLIIQKGEAKIIRKFQKNIQDIINHPSSGIPTAFPWIIVISRIFFDFFMLGGQEYCSFCEQCGKFIVSQRKKRRKTCSNNCRQKLFQKHTQS